MGEKSENNAKGFWGDESHVERLRSYWDEGLSAGQISKAFGGKISRKAICGKVHRLGLSSRGGHDGESANKPYVRKRAAQKPRLVIVRDQKTSPPVFVGPIGEFPPRGRCQYTPDDPAVPGWQMCGNPVVKAGYSWCSFHAGICFQATQPAPDKAADSVSEAA